MRARRVALNVAAGWTSSLGVTVAQLLVMCSTSARGTAGRCSPAHIQCSETGFSSVTSGSGTAEMFSAIVVTYNRGSRPSYAPCMDITLTREGPVAVLTWNEGENRINLDSLARLNELLDQLEGVEGPLSVVLTGSGKFFCNGLDLERFADKREEFVATLHALDERLWSILTNRLSRATATIAATTARRFSGPDALTFGIVEAIASEADVLAHALDVAESMANLDRPTLGVHKRLAHGSEASYLGFEL